MRRSAALVAVVFAAMALMACGGGHRATATRQTAATRQGGLCGDALARVMRQWFIDPSSSVAERLRARRTLDLIAVHAASVVPVCASRVSLRR
jgi:hypothetical protein